jgi:hypothetical protein
MIGMKLENHNQTEGGTMTTETTAELTSRIEAGPRSDLFTVEERVQRFTARHQRNARLSVIMGVRDVTGQILILQYNATHTATQRTRGHNEQTTNSGQVERIGLYAGRQARERLEAGGKYVVGNFSLRLKQARREAGTI